MRRDAVVSRILLTGRPGSGKTTAVAKIARGLRERGMQPVGFITEEVRQGGARVGFDLVGFDGRRRPLARKGLDSQFKVGRYGVDVEGVDAWSKKLRERLEDPVEGRVVVIDEVGKMELFSRSFRDLVVQVVEGRDPLLLTVTQAPLEFPRALLARADLEVIEVAPQNRGAVPDEVLAKVR